MFTTTRDGRRANLTMAERLLVALDRSPCGEVLVREVVANGASEAVYQLARLRLVDFVRGPAVAITPKGRAAAQRLHVCEVH